MTRYLIKMKWCCVEEKHTCVCANLLHATFTKELINEVQCEYPTLLFKTLTSLS